MCWSKILIRCVFGLIPSPTFRIDATSLALQPVIRLYAVPMTAFTAEDDDEGEGFEEEHEFAG